MPEDPVMHHVSASDTASADESAFVDGQGPDGRETIHIDRGGPDGRIASADATPDGKVTDRIEGRASGKDDMELRVAENLVGRLNQLGGAWHTPELLRAGARDERGIDCVARDDAGLDLLIQVTTTERQAWQQLANKPQIERSAESVVVVQAIRTAIVAKATRAAPDIVLALDATDSPRHALRSVANSFCDQHGEWAASIGFAQIWLVGPTSGLVHRLC